MAELKNKKSHREKKNPRSRDAFAKERKEHNAARPKQRWTGGESVKNGGLWTREPIGDLEA